MTFISRHNSTATKLNSSYRNSFHFISSHLLSSHSNVTKHSPFFSTIFAPPQPISWNHLGSFWCEPLHSMPQWPSTRIFSLLVGQEQEGGIKERVGGGGVGGGGSASGGRRDFVWSTHSGGLNQQIQLQQRGTARQNNLATGLWSSGTTLISNTTTNDSQHATKISTGEDYLGGG